jgi:hypothetical protein
MATWTQADIDTLKAACSQGILTVTYAGPPERSITYQSLGAMRALLAEMTAQVTGSPRYRLAATSKGLGR